MKHRVVAIVQARLESSRLPNKVLLDINGKPMLWHVVNRLSYAKELDGIIVAIPKQDHQLHKWLHKKKINHVMGSENNVLDRYYRAATYTNADIIVRITADCPCIDWRKVDEAVLYFKQHNYSYICNSSDFSLVYDKIKLTRSEINYQTLDGFDIECFSFMSLCNAYFGAKDKSDLEHVTPYIVRNESLIDVVPCSKQYPKFHLSVDTEDDLNIVRSIFAKLGNKFNMEEAINVFQEIKTEG